ncbi:MAG: MBL fold metallo-hydrolase, partial [Acidimicrobiales bacterium]|nr:MBL fold metallo-hydrolase [Acidimicrobiales bacterium]
MTADRRRPDEPILSFLGGTGTVTGSRFLIETPQSKVMIECGLFQGLKKLRLRNWEQFPLDPATIDAIVVTHSHIDHIGYLPRLHKLGFRGRVYCTTGTADLARIVLPDSGHLQEEEARYANRKGYSKHDPALPLYTESEARDALKQVQPIEFHQPTSVRDDITITLKPAGHILGSATVTVDLVKYGRRVLFSGDLGRPHHPILTPPAPPDHADVVVMESTYGGRRHDDLGAIDEFGA